MSRLNYPGYTESRLGFSRFEVGIGIGDPVPVMHMSHNVSMDECHDIVERHKLLAPHGVWMINKDIEDTPNLAAAERVGDCGLFLVTRTVVDFRLWRAFYDYSRFVMRLGHFDAWLDSDVRTAAVGSSSEADCSGSTSRVCIWWSEFDLDEQEFSCRPNHEASNVITPAKLLLALEQADVAYPPPFPPPPEPPSAPPYPSPPPGELRCELSAIATTQGRKVPGATRGAGDGAVQLAGEMYELVDQKCWRWDPGNNWPPFVAHRDLYTENPRCGDVRSRDVQWGGGFSQSLMPKDTYDPNEQNNNDCPLVGMNARMDASTHIDRHELAYTLEAGSNCFDKTAIKRGQSRLCELGTNAQSCGVHQNLVVFGFASNYAIVPEGTNANRRCVNRLNGKAEEMSTPDKCQDGGPGAVPAPSRDDEDSTAQCYYGTDPNCGRRRFAFLPEEAGPDVPDDSCEDTMHFPPRYGARNGRCEDGLMWSFYPPGDNPCQPNTDVRHELEPRARFPAQPTPATIAGDRLRLAHAEAHGAHDRRALGHVRHRVRVHKRLRQRLRRLHRRGRDAHPAHRLPHHRHPKHLDVRPRHAGAAVPAARGGAGHGGVDAAGGRVRGRARLRRVGRPVCHADQRPGRQRVQRPPVPRAHGVRERRDHRPEDVHGARERDDLLPPLRLRRLAGHGVLRRARVLGDHAVVRALRRRGHPGARLLRRRRGVGARAAAGARADLLAPMGPQQQGPVPLRLHLPVRIAGTRNAPFEPRACYGHQTQ